MPKNRRGELDPALFVPIVGDGAIAGPVVDGRLIPLLILDSHTRPVVSELIRVHNHLPPGDADSQWAQSLDNKDHVVLVLKFVRPVALDIALRFSIEHQALLIETMLIAGAVYLRAGSAGDRLSTTMDVPTLLVALPDTGFRPVWDELQLERMTTVMSRRLGLPRRNARSIAAEMIAEMRTIAQLQIKQ